MRALRDQLPDDALRINVVAHVRTFLSAVVRALLAGGAPVTWR